MRLPQIVVEGDYCFLEKPILSVDDMYSKELIMTKEAFIECFKKWILEEQKDETDKSDK